MFCQKFQKVLGGLTVVNLLGEGSNFCQKPCTEVEGVSKKSGQVFPFLVLLAIIAS